MLLVADLEAASGPLQPALSISRVLVRLTDEFLALVASNN
jgi:hypothetical protein